MDIYSLQQAEGHPGPQEEDVVTEYHDADEETSTQDDRLSRVSVFCLHAKWSLRDSRDTDKDMYIHLCVWSLLLSSFYTC